ncbi:hypothetical protein [Nocardia aurantia]|uniref:TetR family transcriptional regulator n=1 Tax=Nocardia aurantia TaxID=2585199 RepID=A0A7K0DKY2_9NOCA|nr:hypothetical protein [Nocardia aurantia]MQY25902.1 hypothetical protein [Nocardia aurantia]
MSDLPSTPGGSAEETPVDRAAMFEVLIDSARSVIARGGLGSLTAATIAAEAGVDLGTAQAWFASDARLISELLWRQLSSAGLRTHSGQRGNLGSDALEVLRLRAGTAGEIQHRIRAALGPAPDAATLHRLETIYTAALFDAGTGYAAGSRSREQVVRRILDRR